MSGETAVSLACAFACFCFLLTGCAPKGFKSSDHWRVQCVRQGGEPFMIKVAGGVVCIKTDALIKVTP